MADKRIIELESTNEISVSDFIALDNNEDGTRKIRSISAFDSKYRIMLTQTEYDALPSSKLLDGKVYYITDENKIIVNGELYGGGGTGNVADVYVNGQTVLDSNHIAQIKSYKEVTQAQYDALPSSKLSDGIMYCITDADFDASDVPYSNTTSHAQSTDVQSALDEAFSIINNLISRIEALEG